MNLLLIICLVLLILWFVGGVAVPVGGGLINLLLIVVVILFVIWLIQNMRSR
jgi:hypothetical protein